MYLIFFKMHKKANDALSKFPSDLMVASVPESKMVPKFSPNQNDVELAGVMQELFTRLHGEAGHAIETDNTGNGVELKERAVALLKRKISDIESFIKEIE